MWYIVLSLAIVVLFIALLAEIKSSNKKTDETNNLLSDYQKRVDEQQKLLDDYRALEKNFDNIGEGYEQALLSFDNMEEEKQKMMQTCSQLEQEVAKMKGAYQAVQQNYEIVDQLVKQAEAEAGKSETDAKLIGIIRKLQDLSELGSQAPINVGKRGVPRQIADEAVAQSGILSAKYVRFGIMVADDAADAEFYTTPAKASRVIALLLENSAKFTTDGKVTLFISVADGNISFAVEDSGMGVPAEEAEHVFEPYFKLNSYFDGYGVGLSVARSIARRLGGDVVLDATYTEPGARFVFTLPLAK